MLVWGICIAIADALWYLIGKIHIVELFALAWNWLPLVFRIEGIIPKFILLLVPVLVLGLVLVMSALFTFPILGIYYGVSRAIRRNQKARVRYDVIADIDYFREEFKDLSATDISLLMDLKLERGKDVTATLLSLEQKKWIRIENDRIEPLTGKGDRLLDSEAELLRIIRANQMNGYQLNRWEHVSVQSALQRGLLTSNKDKGRFTFKMFRFVVAFVFCILVFNNDMDAKSKQVDELLASYEPGYSEYDEIDVTLLSKEEQMAILQEQLEIPELQMAVVLIIVMFLQVICGVMIFVLPFVGIGYLISYFVSKPKYKRMKKGKILTEELAGMRNFIHDFSNLKDADKEQIVLWDSFLVYAVVLEENQNIVKEIGRIRRVDLSKFGRLG